MKRLLPLLLAPLMLLLFVTATYAQQGCCSWHGGISHCSGGRYVCNDGSFSPSCTCGGSYIAPIATPIPPVNPTGGEWCGLGNWYPTKIAAESQIKTETDRIFQKGRDSGFESCKPSVESSNSMTSFVFKLLLVSGTINLFQFLGMRELKRHS